MVGFRQHMSTQDVARRIRTDFYDYKSTTHQRTIVGVDIHKAFDNVDPAAMLQNLDETQPGCRLFNYVKNFLTDRTLFIIDPDGNPSQPSALRRGIFQGSILSPQFFDLTLKNLPAQLSAIPDLHHTIYEDDIIL
ncbi:reverse transcriptase, putative [Ixodes scapularis]|uniref:Reverse transcriptase, putative n=1 Tax=Ixodes scapularis TaxID=6945 RepID=B7PJ16_IXOSC|nr:reverse transcriptase, putative [Ixodes scapularis]|eukprot:XP_002406748.1 reverse transcriptase, putative [Ixodes scapularis]